MAGFVDYPLKASKCESLAHVLLKFREGAKGALHCHFMDIPMQKLPFFQIFGDKVFLLSMYMCTIGKYGKAKSFW